MNSSNPTLPNPKLIKINTQGRMSIQKSVKIPLSMSYTKIDVTDTGAPMRRQVNLQYNPAFRKNNRFPFHLNLDY